MSRKLILIKKTTQYELRGEVAKNHLKKGFLSQEEYDRIVSAHEEHHRTLDLVRNALKQRNLDFKEDFYHENANYDSFDGVLTVGGDGTLLAASHAIKSKTILMGIRSSGTSLGSLCTCDDQHVSVLLERFCDNKLKVFEASRLEATIHKAEDGSTFQSQPVLNDFLFTNANAAATTRYRLQLGTIREDQKSSGIWISTATGSTAGINAAGGKVLDKSEKTFQFMIREPIDRKYKLITKIFDPDKENFIIESRCEQALLALDGQHGKIVLSWGDKIQIKRASSIRIAVL